MNYYEPIAELRRIPVYLEDSSREPVLGATPTGSQILVNKSGASIANGAGTWTETGSGNYYYTLTQPETATDSFVAILVTWPGAIPFPFMVDIGNRIVVGESVAAACRVPIFLKDATGNGVEALDLDGEIEMSINGDAFDPVAGTWTETGSGFYCYENDPTELAEPGFRILKVIDAAALIYDYTFDVIPEESEDAGDGGYFGSYFGGPGFGDSSPTFPVEVPYSDLVVGDSGGDLRLTWSLEGEADLSTNDSDIESDRGLKTAALLSLFLDRRAEVDDIPPSGDARDRRGWWADQFAQVKGDRYGSRLWLLDRSVRTNETVLRAEEYVREALAWMLEDRVVESIDVTVETTNTALVIAIELKRPGRDPVSFRFAHAWDHMQEET